MTEIKWKIDWAEYLLSIFNTFIRWIVIPLGLSTILKNTLLLSLDIETFCAVFIVLACINLARVISNPPKEEVEEEVEVK